MYATAYAAAKATNLPESLILMHAAALGVAGDRRRGAALYAAVLERIAAERATPAPVAPPAAPAHPTCVWCSTPVDGEVVRMAGDPLHPFCADELEAELWPADALALPFPVAERVTRDAFAPADPSDAAVVEWETYRDAAWSTGARVREYVTERAAA
jgi:hypothetical protein